MKRSKHSYDDPICPNDVLGNTDEEMLFDSDMQQLLREWFSYDLPDNVAFAIHRFLYDISLLFERTYEDEIRNFVDENRLYENHLHRTDSINADLDDQIPWIDDEIGF